jgi:hypothetical protein
MSVPVVVENILKAEKISQQILSPSEHETCWFSQFPSEIFLMISDNVELSDIKNFYISLSDGPRSIVLDAFGTSKEEFEEYVDDLIFEENFVKVDIEDLVDFFNEQPEKYQEKILQLFKIQRFELEEYVDAQINYIEGSYLQQLELHELCFSTFVYSGGFEF